MQLFKPLKLSNLNEFKTWQLLPEQHDVSNKYKKIEINFCHFIN